MRHFRLKITPGSTLSEAISTIPSDTTLLNLSLNDLGDKNGTELANAVKKISSTVTSLNLSWNNFGNKSGTASANACGYSSPHY